MSENESRPLERWSQAQSGVAKCTFLSREYSHTLPVIVAREEWEQNCEKAAAFDRVLAAWGMTWDEYQNGKAHKQELHKQRGRIGQDG